MGTQNIRTKINKLFEKQKKIKEEIESIQKSCTHDVSVYEARGSTGNWDRDDSYWFNFYCYDCQNRWSHDQKLGHGHSLEVKDIDTKEWPEVIELRIKQRDVAEKLRKEEFRRERDMRNESR